MSAVVLINIVRRLVIYKFVWVVRQAYNITEPFKPECKVRLSKNKKREICEPIYSFAWID